MSLTRLISSKTMVSSLKLAATRTLSLSAPKPDQRSARFAVTGLDKQVNTQWAIDLIAAVPPTVVTKRVVSCDGGGGALGHPKIFINLDQSGPQSCNYCGLRFVLDKGHH